MTTYSGSLTANAYIKKAVASSFTADARIKGTLTQTALADAYIKRIGGLAYQYAVLVDSPISYWRLNDAGSGSGNGTAMLDATGRHNGTWSNLYGTASPTFQSPGFVAGGLSVTHSAGNWQYVNVPDHADFHAGDVFSIEMWFQQDPGASGNQFLWNKGNVAGSANLLIRDTGVLTLDCTGVGDIITGPNLSGDVKPHHLVVTKNGSAAAMYLDGVSVGTTYARTVIDAASAIHIGADAGDGWGWLIGRFAEVAFYAYPLTPTRVSAHYDARSMWSQSLTADANVLKVFTFTADAYVRKTRGPRTITANAFVTPPPSGYTTFTANADGTVTCQSYANPATQSRELWRGTKRLLAGQKNFVFTDWAAPLGKTITYTLKDFDGSGSLVYTAGYAVIPALDAFSLVCNGTAVTALATDFTRVHPLQTETFLPLGSDYAVVLKGLTLGPSGSVTIAADSTVAASVEDSLLAMLYSPYSVYLKDAFGSVYLVSITGLSAKASPVGHVEFSIEFNTIGEA